MAFGNLLRLPADGFDEFHQQALLGGINTGSQDESQEVDLQAYSFNELVKDLIVINDHEAFTELV